MGLGQPNLISSPGTSDPCPVTHTRRTHTAFALRLSLACLGKTDCSTQNVWRLVCCAKPPLTVSGYTVRTPFTICASCPLAPPSPRPLSLSSSCGRPKTQKGRHVSTFCHKPILAKRTSSATTDRPKRGLTSPIARRKRKRFMQTTESHLHESTYIRTGEWMKQSRGNARTFSTPATDHISRYAPFPPPPPGSIHGCGSTQEIEKSDHSRMQNLMGFLRLGFVLGLSWQTRRVFLLRLA